MELGRKTVALILDLLDERHRRAGRRRDGKLWVTSPLGLDEHGGRDGAPPWSRETRAARNICSPVLLADTKLGLVLGDKVHECCGIGIGTVADANTKRREGFPACIQLAWAAA